MPHPRLSLLVCSVFSIAHVHQSVQAQSTSDVETGADALARCGLEPPPSLPFPSDSSLPGIEVELEVNSPMSWPSRLHVDDRGEIPAPVGTSVVASVPIVDRAGVTLAWAALLISGVFESADQWHDSEGHDISFWWFPVGDESLQVWSVRTFLGTYGEGLVNLTAQGDRLLSVCIPADEESEGSSSWVEGGACLTFVDYLAPSPLGEVDNTLPWPVFRQGAQHATFRLLDTDGDGEGELFNRNARINPTTEEPLPLVEQPAWNQLLARINDIELTFDDLQDAYDRFGRLPLRQVGFGNRSRWPESVTCIHHMITDLLVDETMGSTDHRAVWDQLLETLVRSDQERAAERLAIPAEQLPWPMPTFEGYQVPVTLGWESDEQFFVAWQDHPIQMCTASGCEPGEVVEGLPLHVSRTGDLYFNCLAAYDWGWTAFMVGSEEHRLDDSYEFDNPCSCDQINPNGDDDGFFVRIPSNESPLNDDDYLCGLETSEIRRGTGFAGWVGDNQFLWLDGWSSYRITVGSPETRQFWGVEEIPEDLRPIAGYTNDLRYRYFFRNNGVPAVWRQILGSYDFEMIGTIHWDVEDANTNLRRVSSPGAFVIPSPNGRRILVVVNGTPIGVWELTAD